MFAGARRPGPLRHQIGTDTRSVEPETLNNI